MLRHATAPARAFAQIPNLILRHPRLSPAAKTLLTWQLSLPADERQCLSETARRAGIKKTAFQRAKAELLEEGYLHEWRVQAGGGRFRTVQLVSNVVLTKEEAASLRDGFLDGTGCDAGAASREPTEEPRSPSGRIPAVGEPTGRAVGRQPKKNTEEKNTTQPAGAAVESGPPEADRAATEPVLREDGEARRRERAAEVFLRALVFGDRRLAMSERALRDTAPLAVPWLRSELSTEQISHALTQGLAEARSPVGLLRWRLKNLAPQSAPPSSPAAASPPPPPRVASMRECRGSRHTQPMLFTPPPGSDRELCPACRAAEEGPSPSNPASGLAWFRAARRKDWAEVAAA